MLRRCVVTLFLGAATIAHAGAPKGELDSLLVTANKGHDPVADARLASAVLETLHADPYFYDGHVTVTVRDGVLTLSGMVFDEWDLSTAQRLARRVPGVKRIINQLELQLGGE